MIVSIEGHTPDVSSAAFVADNATVCGDVKVGGGFLYLVRCGVAC